MKTINSPILLLVFNRPRITSIVFNRIREVKPSKLYVAIDGPRKHVPTDKENIEAVKAIVTNVDWPCETHYLFHEENLGCTKSGVTAWKWLFSQEDRMIFVEDDGLATLEAFYYVDDLLERYKDNNRILYIGGENFGPKYGDKSYFFSRYPAASMFMGTWKRVFDLYDYNLDSYEEVLKTKEYRDAFLTKTEFLVMNQWFSGYRRPIKKGKAFRRNTYDTQMDYLAYRYNGYSIYPNVNMVSNIGLDAGANNNVSTKSDFYKEYAYREVGELGPIKYNDDVIIDPEFEKAFFKKRMMYLRPWWYEYMIATILKYFEEPYRKYIRTYRLRFYNWYYNVFK